MSPGVLFTAAAELAVLVAAVPVPEVTVPPASSCLESLSRRSIISVSRTVVVVFVPPSVVPESAESSDRSLESELEPRREVRRVESESLPNRDESVLSPVVDESPRSDDAERPVPSRLLELLEELELDESVLLDELSDVEMFPAEIVGMEGMDGPEIDGMLMLEMLLWAVRREVHAISRSTAEKAVILQDRKLFFDHFEA